MSTEFDYDIFLSHSVKDKEIVSALAKRLKDDGLRVWFDKFEIGIGTRIPRKIEDGLEHSQSLILFMSANSFDSEWVKLEADVFRFRDLPDSNRKFIPVRIDKCPIKGSLNQIAYIDWLSKDREMEYAELLMACSPNTEMDSFHESCWNYLEKESGISDRKLIESLLTEIKKLAIEPFDRWQCHWGIARTLTAIIAQKPSNELLKDLKSEIIKCLKKPTTKLDYFKKCIDRLIKESEDTLKLLAINGAKNIQDKDVILLYATSQSVSESINQWLTDHPKGIIVLYICLCFGKELDMKDPWVNAVSYANTIRRNYNITIHFLEDYKIGYLFNQGTIKKVFFGAHDTDGLPFFDLSFKNTPGTLAIAAAAKFFKIPVFVFAETKKKVNENVSASNVSYKGFLKYLPDPTVNHPTIRYDSFYDERIDSSSIPFVVVNENGITSVPADMRKRNIVKISDNGKEVTKTTTSIASGKSERNAILALNILNKSKALNFNVPKPLNNTNSDSVGMERIKGVRMYDFIATMNNIKSRDSSEFKNNALQWAIEDVNIWQSDIIQKSLTNIFGHPTEIYEFEHRFNESIGYVWAASDQLSSSKSITEDVKEFAASLTNRATLFLRDANPKNQILAIKKLLKNDLPDRCKKDNYFPMVDYQWFDSEIAELLLNKVPHEITWEKIRSNIWNVDFESASCLTTPEDDYIHILTQEIFAFQYDDIITRIHNQLPEVDINDIYKTMLFRCFRAWVRRLYYFREENKTYHTRYRHEKLPHYHNLAKTAASNLKGIIGDDLIKFIEKTKPN